MNLGELIKKYRKNANLTQEELSEKLQLSKSFISKIETDNKRPSPEVLSQIMYLLKIPDYEIEENVKPSIFEGTNGYSKDLLKLLNESLNKYPPITVDELFELEDNNNCPVFRSIEEYSYDILQYWKDIVFWYPLDIVNEFNLNELKDEEYTEIAKALEITFNLKVIEIKNRKKEK